MFRFPDSLVITKLKKIMSDEYKRKHESGFEKRNKKVENEDALKKMQGSLLKYVKANTSCINDKDISVTSSQPSVTTPEIMPTDSLVPAKQNKTNVEQVCQGVTNVNQSGLNPIDIYIRRH